MRGGSLATAAALSSLLAAVSLAATPLIIVGPPLTMPLVFTAPHGGYQTPDNIPSRSHGCWIDSHCEFDVTRCRRLGHPAEPERCRAVTVHDSFSQELLQETALAVSTLARACTPGTVRNNLKRTKMDPNRPEDQSTNGPAAKSIYKWFHAEINETLFAAQQRFGFALLVDFHVHGHPESLVELGYRLTAENLSLSDTELDRSIALLNASSLHSVVRRRSTAREPRTLSSVLRGPNSLGGRLVKLDDSGRFLPVPSPPQPAPPDGAKYFRGGFITHTYSRSERVTAVQIEMPSRVMRSESERSAFAKLLARALFDILERWWSFDPAECRLSKRTPLAAI